MPTIVTCSCGQKLRIPDGAGAARCPACKARVPVPAADRAGSPPAPPPPRPQSRPDDDRSRRERPAPRKKSLALPLALGGCALLLLLGCGGAVGGYFLFFHDRKPDSAQNQAPTPPAPPRELKGHENMVTTLAFSKDGKALASGSLDKTLRVWDVAAGAEKKAVAHRHGPVWAAAWTADGLVATGSGDEKYGVGGAVTWIDPADGSLRKTKFDPRGKVRALAASPDGTRLAWVGPDGLVLGPADPAAPEGRPTPYAVNVLDATHLAFRADGKRLLIASNLGLNDWDLNPANPFRPFRRELVRETTGVGAVSEGLYAVASNRGGVVVINLMLGTAEPVTGLPQTGAYGIAVPPDGKSFASAVENGVRFFDPVTRQEVGRVVAPAGPRVQFTCVAISPDGSKVAAGGGFSPLDNPKNFSVFLWDVAAVTPPKRD